MRHPVLWAVQVRAASSSQAREDPTLVLPSSLAEPEAAPEPGWAWGSFTFLCPPRHNRGRPSTSHLALPFPLPARSFCWEHRPQQAVQAAPEQDTICIICMDPVGDSKSYHTMVCPACSHAWFHRGCIQEMAIHTDNVHIKCPICRNRVEFRSELCIMGIRGIQVPVRGPTWENNNASASLQERRRRCTVGECLYPQGREQAEGQGPWQLLLCRSCAAEGTHRRCSNLTNSTGTWDCDRCAGLGTSSQAAPGPLQGIPVTDSTRQERDQATIRHVLWAPDTFNQPQRRHETSAESSTHSPNAETAPGTSNRPTVPEGRLPAGQRGQPRTRSRSLLECPAPDPQRRPRRRRRSSHAPENGAGSSSSTRSARGAASGSPSGSPGPRRRRRSSQQGTARTRSRSPLQHQAPNTQRQTQRRRGSRRATTPSAQGSSSSSFESETAPGSSSDSLVPERSSRSSHAGPVRMRSRSRLQHRAPNPYGRPEQRHGSSRAPAPRPGSSPQPPSQ
ncbi:pineapple eye protein-like [Anser cygnoides]|uniref:pineapple eye protein-like n=1 Tax=Anser cygnoides TaxID=8845 RepID=UPI0034D16FED